MDADVEFELFPASTQFSRVEFSLLSNDFAKFTSGRASIPFLPLPLRSLSSRNAETSLFEPNSS